MVFPKLHGKAHNLLRKLRFDYDDVLSKVDVLLMPTLPWVARKLVVSTVATAQYWTLLTRPYLQPADSSPLTHFKEHDGLVRRRRIYKYRGIILTMSSMLRRSRTLRLST